MQGQSFRLDKVCTQQSAKNHIDTKAGLQNTANCTMYILDPQHCCYMAMQPSAEDPSVTGYWRLLECDQPRFLTNHSRLGITTVRTNRVQLEIVAQPLVFTHGCIYRKYLRICTLDSSMK